MKKHLFPLFEIDRTYKSGVSLVETIIALLILSIAIFAIAGVPIMATKLALSSTRHEQAMTIGVRELNALEADSRAEIPERSVETGFSAFTANSSKLEGMGNVTVRWQGGEVIFQRTLSTFSNQTRTARKE